MTNEPSNAVLPAYAMSGDGGFSNAGCGFIVKAIDGTHWLLTVAHMPCWGEPRPNMNFGQWSPNLFAVDRKVGRISVGLFNAPGQPRCRLIHSEFGEPASVRNPSRDGILEDVLAAQFPLALYQRAGAFKDVHVIDMSSPTPPIQGPGEIVAHGFPVPEPGEVARGRKWPDAVPSVAHGNLYDIQNSRYMADMSCSSGYCGASVFKADGSFVGMINGSDHDTHTLTRIVPGFVIWALVNDQPIDGLMVPAGFENAPSARGCVGRFRPLGRIIGDGRQLSPNGTSLRRSSSEQIDAA